MLAPWEAALLAGMVADPSAYDPLAHPRAAWARRKLVLHDMYQQHYISAAEYAQDINRPLPTEVDVQQPSEPTAAPYFTSWLRPQVLAAMGLGHGVPANVAEYRAYYGGLQIRTTLDLKLQQAAEQTVAADLPYTKGGPAASLVAIDNKTGEVRAMVGGPIVNGHEDFNQYPFNLATQGHRQPGSAFKPFTLAVALESGVTPDTLFTSAPISFVVPHSRGKEHFVVRNFGDNYSGVISLANATAVSDNSVYARLGIQRLGPEGTTRVAAMAHAMGIRSALSTNYAMILGGLSEGVTPLDMAHAYETFATGGKRVYSTTLGTPDEGPTGIAQIRCYVVSCHGRHSIDDHPQYARVLPGPVAKTVHDVLAGVVNYGTATKAGITGVDVVGKTGTTSNYGDAWFVGWTPQMTVAVWVGVPDRLVPMSTLYNGQPVEGGTYPAIIWHDFVTQALQILATENPKQNGQSTTSASTLSTPGSGVSGSAGTGTVPSTTPSSSAPANGTTPAAHANDSSHRTPDADHTRDRWGPPPRPGTGGGTPTTPGRRWDGRQRRRHAYHGRNRARRRRRRRRPRRGRLSRPPRQAVRAPVALPAAVSGQPLGLRGDPHRARDVATPGHGEAPLQLGRLGDPDPAITDDLAPAPAGGRRGDEHGPGGEVGAVVLELDAECLGELARPGAQIAHRAHAPAQLHEGDAVERFQRADEDRRAHTLGLADRVEQGVDAVGPIHVGAPRWPEQRVGAGREADMGMAGGLGVVVGLGLDDHARALAVADHAADQVSSDLEHRARVEAPASRLGRARQFGAQLRQLGTDTVQAGAAL